MFLVGSLRGGFSFRNGFISIGSKSKNVVFDKTFEMEDIKNIEIKQDAGDVIFKETTNDNIQVVLYGEDINDVEVKVNEGNLNID